MNSVLILSHYYKRANAAGGPPQELRDFLVPKVKTVVYIEHPFPYADDRRSSVTIYEGGKETVYYTPALYGPEAWFYLADIFITWYFLLKVGRRYDLCVALDNLNTLSVWPAKCFGTIKRLVFYTIDYSPKRFENRVLNWIYLTVDRLACYVADTVWVLSMRMIAAREQSGVKSRHNLVVPMGAKLNRITPLPIDKINRHQLIFVGHLLQKQGLQLVIEALPKIIAKVPTVRLVVIGQGEYEANLKSLASNLQVEPAIEWRGFVAKHTEVEAILCHAAIGLAPYIPSDTSYTYFTDPGKPKLYLGCGLPVIITDFPESAELIASHGAGIIVEPTSESIAKALIMLLTNDKVYREYRQKALALSKDFDTNTILAKAIEQTIEQTNES